MKGELYYDFSVIVASKLHEDGKLSAGKAAEMAGLSKRTFSFKHCANFCIFA
jgi:predicted HTH domain antitoxin